MDEFKIFNIVFTVRDIIAIAAIMVTIITFSLNQYFTNRRAKKKINAKTDEINELKAQLDEPYSFWIYLLNNPFVGGTMEMALKFDILTQRKFVKDNLEKLVELEKIYGVGDSELKLEARTPTDEDISKAKAMILNLARNQVRNSTFKEKTIWDEYFEERILENKS